MPVDWKRFILILVTGVAAGLAWNAASGRGFALGRSVLVQAGDEIVEAADAKRLLDRGALFLDARPRDFWRMNRIPAPSPRSRAGSAGRAASSSTAAASGATRATSWRASCASAASSRRS
jgi:hypothetical protein